MIFQSMDASIVCVTLQTKYVLVNIETANLMDLFPCDRETDTPFIKRVESVSYSVTAASLTKGCGLTRE